VNQLAATYLFANEPDGSVLFFRLKRSTRLSRSRVPIASSSFGLSHELENTHIQVSVSATHGRTTLAFDVALHQAIRLTTVEYLGLISLPIHVNFSLFCPCEPFLHMKALLPMSDPLGLVSIKPQVIFATILVRKKSRRLERTDCCIRHSFFCHGTHQVIIASQEELTSRHQPKWLCGNGLQTF
jgi:hypothetical protein